MTDDDDIRAIIRQALAEGGAYYRELEGESPRAAAVLVVANLENMLTVIVRSRFPETVRDSVWKRLSGSGPTPLSSLKVKADFIEACGFIGSKTNKAIERIGTIRNRFAHRHDIRDFGHTEIRHLCAQLGDNPVFPYKLLETATPNDVRWHYIETVKEIHERLEAILQRAPRCPEPIQNPLP